MIKSDILQGHFIKCASVKYYVSWSFGGCYTLYYPYYGPIGLPSLSIKEKTTTVPIGYSDWPPSRVTIFVVTDGRGP